MRRALILLGALFAAFLPHAQAQSLFGSRGLGLPLDPLDARARALGSTGMGLWGPSLNPVDLASAARIFLPSAQLTFQPQWVDGELDGSSSSTRGTRFPQLGLAYPVPAANGTAFMHIGSFLDQRWEVVQSSTELIGGDEVPVEDRFRSRGGVSTFQLGWAQRIGDDLSLGFGVGSRIGSVSRTFTRRLDVEGDIQVVPYETGTEWQYSGLTGAVSFQWDPFEAVRFGGGVTFSQDLEAKPGDGSDSEKETFAIPTEYRLGASGILTPRLAITAGFSFADWKGSEGGLDSEDVAGSVVNVGGGIEWAGPTLGPRNFPIRMGWRRGDLPFTYNGETPTENVFTGGIGLNLMPQGRGMIGAIDLGFERGSREAGLLTETFWRGTVTVKVGSF